MLGPNSKRHAHAARRFAKNSRHARRHSFAPPLSKTKAAARGRPSFLRSHRSLGFLLQCARKPQAREITARISGTAIGNRHSGTSLRSLCSLRLKKAAGLRRAPGHRRPPPRRSPAFFTAESAAPGRCVSVSEKVRLAPAIGASMENLPPAAAQQIRPPVKEESRRFSQLPCNNLAVPIGAH